MSSLFHAMNDTALTDNGARTNHSSLDSLLDLFFVIGASRGKDISYLFTRAMVQDPELVGRVLLWARDIRGGAGERDTFRKLVVNYIDSLDSAKAESFVRKIVEVGRWDDLFVLFGTNHENLALSLFKEGLEAKNGLCAKWIPRQGANSRKIAKFMGIHNPKVWRKLLVSLSNTVEQKMCAKEWDKIVYEHVPSVASSRYKKAFNRNDTVRFAAYVEALLKGEAKINASAIFPHDIIKGSHRGVPETEKKHIVAQWAALPNYMEGATRRILPMVDVSGSMTCEVSRGLTALDVAVALGLYISERNEGIFKDQFLTFSATPELVQLKGDVVQRLLSMHRASWDMNTDLNKAFRVVLDSAKRHNVPKEQMPNQILILSDMEFDEACEGNSITNFQAIEKLYEESGYEMPEVVFWNLNGRAGNVPVTRHQSGTCLVSGFSPSILKRIVKGVVNPQQIMMDTIMDERYSF